MPRIVLLGTGSALCGPDRENTYLFVEGGESRILIDCAGSPAQRLARAGVGIETVDKVILTHTHPDHIYGFPIFALDAWIAGRRKPLHVHGLAGTLQAARTILQAVGCDAWPDFFQIEYHLFEPDGISILFKDEDFIATATLTDHFVPTLSVRFESRESGAAVAYSCDTAPLEPIVKLASRVRYFFHEATTLDQPTPGHSSAVQAGQDARQSGADRLVLLHLPPEVRPAEWRAAAQREFAGHVIVAEDLQSFAF